MNWKKNPLAFAPKPTPRADSWWTRPELQRTREAFQRQLVTEEMQRMNTSDQFGGSKRVIDKFPQKP